jgi:hypothetical protein
LREERQLQMEAPRRESECNGDDEDDNQDNNHDTPPKRKKVNGKDVKMKK